MGWPIGHSLSPRLHGFWLRQYAVLGSYEAFAIKPGDLSSALHSLKSNALVGVNLTIPHKVAAYGLVDILDPTAKRIGAVNLVTVEEDERLLGQNTDAYGFEQNLLSAGVLASGKAAFVLGAGGACRAVLVALQNMGVSEIRLANRTKESAAQLAVEFSIPSCPIVVVEWALAPEQISDVELLVNTTSLGMKGQPDLDFSLSGLSRTATVSDVVYAPLETSLLACAKSRGNKAVDGLGMLLHQARPAFRAFFGIDPEVTKELREFVLAEKKV